jgi:hypothetical protein
VADDRAGGATDASAETAEQPPADEQRPPPDRPGAEDVPSRAESRKAVAAKKQVNDRPAEDKPGEDRPAEEKLAEDEPDKEQSEVVAAPQESIGEQDTEATEDTMESSASAESSAEEGSEQTETPNDETAAEASHAVEVADEGTEESSSQTETEPAEDDTSADADTGSQEAAEPADSEHAQEDEDSEDVIPAEDAPETAEPLPDDFEDQTSPPEDMSKAAGKGREQGVQEPVETKPTHKSDTEKKRQEVVGSSTEIDFFGPADQVTSNLWDGREPSDAQERSDDGPYGTSDQAEPGSWRGDRGQYLNMEENLVTEHAFDRVRDGEQRVTDDLHAIAQEVSGGELTGLEFRLKGEERFKEKLAVETRQKPELSIGRIAEAVPDAVRYTYRFDKDAYVRGHERVRQRLEERGYAMVFSRNSWDSPDYKGINTRWRTPEGHLFEAQFHTPESFAAKQETHGAYERIRSPGISDQERQALMVYQQEVSALIPVPDEVNAIPDYREKRY